MGYEYNGKTMTREEFLAKIDDPNTVVESVIFESKNEKKSDTPPTMEGFSITADFMIELAQKSNEFDAEVTATFENCGKLGGKTVIITVK